MALERTVSLAFDAPAAPKHVTLGILLGGLDDTNWPSLAARVASPPSTSGTGSKNVGVDTRGWDRRYALPPLSAVSHHCDIAKMDAKPGVRRCGCRAEGTRAVDSGPVRWPGPEAGRAWVCRPFCRHQPEVGSSKLPVTMNPPGTTLGELSAFKQPETPDAAALQ